MSRPTPSSIDHDSRADDSDTTAEAASPTPTPGHAPAVDADASAPEDPDLSWWCVTNERLALAAGILGWALLLAAFLAAATQRTTLTVLSLLLLAVVGVESSPWRSTRTRIALAVAAQVIAVVFLAGRL